VQPLVNSNQTLNLKFDAAHAATFLAGKKDIDPNRSSFVIVYAYGDFTAETTVARSDDTAGSAIQINRESCVPANRVEAFFKNPFADTTAAQTAPLKIQKALISPIPDTSNGWLVAISMYAFMSFYAIGPGVCVWLALSELMPTRIRSNGMSIALVINQIVSTTLAAIFLPIVSNYGYSTIFFVFAAFTAIYFVTALFFLPETKGKTLEQIETYFEGASG
jgi:MFS transporter, SP family, solute carrier family 2 (myo-inositol transporter), member 13